MTFKQTAIYFFWCNHKEPVFLLTLRFEIKKLLYAMVDQYIVRGLAAIPSLGISLTLRRETLRIYRKISFKSTVRRLDQILESADI